MEKALDKTQRAMEESLAGISLAQIVSDVNPFKHIVDALRAVFRGEVTTPIVWLGLALAVLLAIVGGWVGNRSIVRQTK